MVYFLIGQVVLPFQSESNEINGPLNPEANSLSKRVGKGKNVFQNDKYQYKSP